MPDHHFGASSSFQISQPAARPAKCCAARPTNEAKAEIAAGVLGGAEGSPMTTNTGLTPICARSATASSYSDGLFEVNMKKRAPFAPESRTFCRSAFETGIERLRPGSAAAWAAAGATSEPATQSRDRRRSLDIERIDRLALGRS